MKILKKSCCVVIIFALFMLITIPVNSLEQNITTTDPLPSWNNGPVKQRIIHFVQSVTDKNSPQYTPVAERIATIDNDGTLWLEQPLYTQALFAIDRIKTLAPQHPEWKTEAPFNAILTNNRQALANLNLQDFEKIIAVTHSGMSVEAFQHIVQNWLATTNNPRFNRPYIELVYQPMLELMNYLRANDFKVYIVTGGGQDFIRTFSEQVYGVTVSQVIGSANKTKYVYRNGKPVLIKQAEVFLIDDKQGKPEAINMFIGLRPLIAIGNSDGDRQMLEWAQARPGAHFMMLIHHDDSKREYAYGAASKIGTFSDSLLAEAQKNNWTIVSMKNDWNIIFHVQNKP